jgi:alpha-L-fucosidase 2
MKITPALFAFMLGLFALPQVSRADGLPAGEWPAVLRRYDMVWNQLPERGDNAPFLGNGNLGTIFWLTRSNVFHFEVSRSDLYDHRLQEDNYLALHTECRLPNGQFLLDLRQPKLSSDLRLDLWNAEPRGNVSAGDATWAWRCFTHAKMDVIVLE